MVSMESDLEPMAMFEYKLDDLGWEGFEKLVQALLKAKLGLGIEAWGGSGDWGRDSYFHGELNYPTHEPRQGGFVFQSKFIVGANAAGAKPDVLILNAVRKECLRIKANMASPGRWVESPTCYALFTNAVLKPAIRSRIKELIKKELPTSEVCTHDSGDVCAWLQLSPEIAKNLDPLNKIVDSIHKKEIRAKINLAQTLVRQEKRSEGLRELEAALALAQVAKLVEEEIEVLLALCLLSSSCHGIGNRRGYLDQAEQKLEEIKDASVRVLYFRAKAAACSEDHNLQEAEDALWLAVKCCENAEGANTSEKKNLLTQACVVRSELIIHLCQQDRHNEAAELVAACDAYARDHTDNEDGELMQSAMSAGIFWALKTGNEENAIRRIHELEATAQTGHQAGRIAGQLSNMANSSSRMEFHKVALVAAEAAVRLGEKVGDKDGFLVGGTLHSRSRNISVGRPRHCQAHSGSTAGCMQRSEGCCYQTSRESPTGRDRARGWKCGNRGRVGP